MVQIRPDTRVSLFVTCLVDQLYPQVGESMVKVLKRLGVKLSFPREQTCCGQPAFNSGYTKEARALAQRFLSTFQDSDYIVCPSGSCTSMVRRHYQELFAGDPELQRRAQEIADKTYEFSQFLVQVLHTTDVRATYHGKVTYHDSCHLLRELGIAQEPRQLIAAVKGVEMVEMDEASDCCGFGGAFAVKYPDISTAILEDKLHNIEKTGAQTLVACDTGCLMHMAGAMRRRKMPVKAMHLAELLASEDASSRAG